MSRIYLTVSIPYVNARPHLGYALELVEADVVARTRRLLGEEVRFLGGTDENALKNVLAAEQAGIAVAALVEENAERFAALRLPLDITFDDFIRTSTDPRHRPAVEALWRVCAKRGDFYLRRYEGRYCVGCEQFYLDSDLVDDCCPEHGTPPEFVAEENWFFRLSRYQDQLLRLIESKELVIAPDAYRNEVLGVLRGGLEDISVSRPSERARGWGIPVPGDPSQVVYVWWDALANYVSALGYGGDPADYRRWWVESDERVHVIGKGILRFHALYWPALLMSAGEPLPTTIYVHPYLTADGQKLSKSSGHMVDPVDVVDAYGSDALRWWLVRDVPPAADTDYTAERLIARANEDLANGIGNLTNRTITMARQVFSGGLFDGSVGERERHLIESARLAALRALDLRDFDFRAATAPLLAVVADANRLIEEKRPWELVKSDPTGAAGVLRSLLDACGLIAKALSPFVPTVAARLQAQLDAPLDGALPPPGFRRLDPPS